MKKLGKVAYDGFVGPQGGKAFNELKPAGAEHFVALDKPGHLFQGPCLLPESRFSLGGEFKNQFTDFARTLIEMGLGG